MKDSSQGDCIVYSVDGELTSTAQSLSQTLPHGEMKIAHGELLDVGIRSCAQLADDLGGLKQYMMEERGRAHCISASGYDTLQQAQTAVQAKCQANAITCDEYAIDGQRASHKPKIEAPHPASGVEIVAGALDQAADVANQYQDQKRQIQLDQQAARDTAAHEYQGTLQGQQQPLTAPHATNGKTLGVAPQQALSTNSGQSTRQASATRSVQSTPSSSRSQSHPSYRHQSIVQTDPGATIDGVPGTVSDFIVRITNTGDVRLSCHATAKARLAYSNGGSCTGVNAQDCLNGRVETASSTQDVYAGGNSDIVVMRYYLGNGSYSVQCDADP